MFGLTIRASDRQRSLMGQAVLHIHNCNGRQYMPEGYWCGRQDSSGLPLAIEDEGTLNRFRREWKLTRNDEPGLSVVAPYVHEDLKAERLLQAVAVHFFTRILRGELVVEVVGRDVGTVTLDKATLAAACQRIRWDGPKRTKRHIAPPIDFVQQCLEAGAPALESPVLGTERLPDLDEDSFAETELRELRRRFSAGELIGLRVRIWLPKRQGAGEKGAIDVWVRRDLDGTRCDAYFVREGMTITKINSRAALQGVHSLVIVDKGPLATLLGDTEGPAHEDWDTSAERPDRLWKTWKGRVKFVRGIVDGLVELLTPPATEPNFDLLSDFFSIERTAGDQRQRETGDEFKDKPVTLIQVTATPKWYRITERAGGFTVGRTPGVPLPANATLKVSVAYDIPRGDPLHNWSPLDFQIGNEDGNLRPQGRGLKAQRLQGNILLAQVTNEDFNLAIGGFDSHRDLFVRVDDVSNATEAAE